MNKTERLFKLLQILQERRYPVTGQALSDLLGVSLRTVYRDITDLQLQGADIEGEAGIGFQLKPGYLLPPLMFNSEEIEAMVLGLRWVYKKADKQLQLSSQSSLNKISAVLPEKLKNQLQDSGLMVGPGAVFCASEEDILLIRKSIQDETKLSVDYLDVNKTASSRIIWPLGLAYFENVRVVIAWCELRQDFRHFRTDRFKNIMITNQKYIKSRSQLLKKWRQANNIPEQ